MAGKNSEMRVSEIWDSIEDNSKLQDLIDYLAAIGGDLHEFINLGYLSIKHMSKMDDILERIDKALKVLEKSRQSKQSEG